MIKPLCEKDISKYINMIAAHHIGKDDSNGRDILAESFMFLISAHKRKVDWAVTSLDKDTNTYSYVINPKWIVFLELNNEDQSIYSLYDREGDDVDVRNAPRA
jgi:hypothetical protein